jgi:PAS domain S-box-containing protein
MTPEKSKPNGFKGKNLLVADDDQTILNLFRMIFEREGCRVVMATNGQAAVEEIKHNPIDVAILDIRMPVMGGLEALKEIKKYDPTISVLIVTGYADMEDLREAIQTQGAVDYILKPFNVADITHTVRTALLKREASLQRLSVGRALQEKIHEREREFAERTLQLRESQIKYRQIIENSNDMILVLQGERIHFANPKTMELTGYSEAELSQIPSSELIDPGDRAMVEGMDAGISAGKVPSLTSSFRMRRKNGESFWVEANTIRTQWEERPAILKFIRDISARKKAEEELQRAYEELKEMQGKLIQSEKMAALGRFSAGITHEIKNPLSIIIGGTDFLSRKLRDADEDTHKALKKIKEAALRADSILMGLLKFSRPSKLTVEPIDPVDLVQETLSLLQYRAPFQNIRIVTDFPAEPMQIRADKAQLQQVLLNLFLNAQEAMGEEGQITVRVYGERKSLPHGGKPACIIEVIDSGMGISPENLPKVFEPFFTTKRDMKGTGLGLSISKMIVDHHGGSMTLQSETGKGTKVQIILPWEEGGMA